MAEIHEYVDVPVSLWGIGGDIAEASLTALVRGGLLPPDFAFRALVIENSRERQRIALQDIRAVLGLGDEPSGHPYLTQELPDCIAVPVGPTKSRKAILRGIETDYHILGTLLDLAEEQCDPISEGYNAWAGYIKYLDPERYERIAHFKAPGSQRHSFNKEYCFRRALHEVVIRDSALMPIFENPGLIPNHGPKTIKYKLLRTLLADNHGEIFTPE